MTKKKPRARTEHQSSSSEPAVVAPSAAVSSGRSLFKTAQAAEILGVAAGTLAAWRCSGRYSLKFVKMGSRVLYRRSDLEAFISNHVVNPTAP